MPEGKGKGDAQTGASQRRLKKKFIKSYVPEGTWLCLRERGRLAQAEKLSGEGGRRAGWRQLAQTSAQVSAGRKDHQGKGDRRAASAGSHEGKGEARRLAQADVIMVGQS